ncbi:MAG: radical SAM family heme chaperone HemW [Acidobacteria bacterium]|nr:MAG: radical SAM family heme chaperone HemW [Acidobacteriota bacterium]
MGEYRDMAAAGDAHPGGADGPWAPWSDPDPGLYVHVPFCARRCDYCDFAIVAGRDDLAPRFVALVARELDRLPEGAVRAASVHLGGGTPSRLPPELLGRLLDAVRGRFEVAPDAEIGLEANPEDVSPARAAAWRAAGIDRVTLGLQALDEGGLAAIGREGTVAEGLGALATLRAAGFVSLGVDLIFGRPGQTMEGWLRELERLAELDVDHVSLYALELDGRTPLVRAIEGGTVPRPDPDLAAEMYAAAVERLAARGLRRYEISNFARPGHESRHNLRYWTDESYLGVGPSAASYWRGARWTAPRGFGAWARAIERGAGAGDPEPWVPDRRAGEAIVLGLRLDRGVDLGRVARRHGRAAVDARRDAIARHLAAGALVRQPDGRIALAESSRLIADEVFVDLL